LTLEARPDLQTATVTFVDADGKVHNIEAEIGKTLMEAAIDNGIAGIEATCGGSCACATCHVVVDPAWFERVGAPSEMEAGTLYFGAPRRPTSRLSCQVVVTRALDGLRVAVAT